tara:strand:+ start:503 stop:625 length:123 start_codon:yes stop_codon:yes gene_type:complete
VSDISPFPSATYRIEEKETERKEQRKEVSKMELNKLKKKK